MVADLRRRIALLERHQPTVSHIERAPAGQALAKVVAFVEEHGGRHRSESWADALARVEGIATAQLRAALSGNGNSRYPVEAAR